MRAKWLAALAVAACLMPMTALAGGEIYVREATSTDVAECGGKVFEKFHDGGDVHGWYSSLAIACVTGDGTAEWVLVSDTDCYDAEDTATCGTKVALSIPPLAADPDYWDAEKQKAPFRVDYHLIKWGFGRNCHVVEQPISSGYEDVVAAWLCETLELGDGTHDATTYQPLVPSKFELRRVMTEGRTILTPSREDGPLDRLAMEFIIDRTGYSYHYGE